MEQAQGEATMGTTLGGVLRGRARGALGTCEESSGGDLAGETCGGAMGGLCDAGGAS